MTKKQEEKSGRNKKKVSKGGIFKDATVEPKETC
jgi:hypothetical protein